VVGSPPMIGVLTACVSLVLSPPPQRYAGHARSSVGDIVMGSTSDFKVGLTIEVEGAPWKIVEFLHVKPGKGPAFVRSKLKNVQTGATLDKTWKAGESFPDAQIDKVELQYSYIDGDDHVFMNMETFEEERIPSKNIDKADFIKEEMLLNVLYYKGVPIDVQVPGTMTLKVTEASPADASAGKDKMSKMVELETGYRISVPAFIKEGDMIRIDTDKREYLGRDNQ